MQIPEFLFPVSIFDIYASSIKKQKRNSIINKYFTSLSDQQIITDIEPYEYIELYVDIHTKIYKNSCIKETFLFKQGLVVRDLTKDNKNKWYISVINTSNEDIDILKGEKIAEALLLFCPLLQW